MENRQLQTDDFHLCTYHLFLALKVFWDDYGRGLHRALPH